MLVMVHVMLGVAGSCSLGHTYLEVCRLTHLYTPWPAIELLIIYSSNKCSLASLLFTTIKSADI